MGRQTEPSRTSQTTTLLRVCVAGVCGALVSGASAQVAPPPPPPSEPAPEYVPPAPPPARPVAPRSSEPTSSQAVTGANQPERPSMGFVSLVELDDEGKIIQLETDPRFLALVNNPIVRDQGRDPIMDVVRERRRSLEKRLIANSDVVLRLENGMLADFSFENIPEATRATQMIQTLVLQPNLTADLRERGVIGRLQADVNEEIARGYQPALNQERRGAGGEQRLSAMLVGVIEDSLIEVMDAYEAMLEQASGSLPAVIASAELASAPEAEKLRSLGAGAPPERIREAIKTLTPDQLSAFLEGIVAQRADPDDAPVPDISFEPPADENEAGE